jgi:hypothetical protein
MKTDDPKSKKSTSESKPEPVPAFFPPEIRRSVAGKKITVEMTPNLKVYFKAMSDDEYPNASFLPDGANMEAWNRVKDYIISCKRIDCMDGSHLAWKIFFSLRPGMDAFRRAKAILPPSKRLAKIKQVAANTRKQIETLPNYAEYMPEELESLLKDAVDDFSNAHKKLVKATRLSFKGRQKKATVQTRKKFIINTYNLLKSFIPEFEKNCEYSNSSEYQLLCDICITAGLIKRKNEFPDYILRELKMFIIPQND